MRLMLAPLLLGLLPTSPQENAPTVEQLIRQLGDGSFEVREQATARLRKIGAPALPALRKAAEQSTDFEIQRRAASLVARIEKDLSGELLTISGQPGYWVNRIAFSADGKQAIATGGGVIWYDLASGKEVRRVMELQFARAGFALSADRRTFVTGHQRDNAVRIGDAATGVETAVLRGHTAGVWAVAFAADGSQVVSGGDDGTVRLWDVRTGKEVRKFEHGRTRVQAVTIAPDGKTVASGAAGNDLCPIVLWDAGTGKEVKRFTGHRGGVTTLLFLPDGRRLLSAGGDGAVVVWDVETGKELKRLSHGPGNVVVNQAALSPDGKRVLTAGFQSRQVFLWDLDSGKEIRRFEGHPGAVLGVAFAPDGKRALSSDSQGTVKLWKVPD
jgi:WD40 repeat protein